MHGLTNKGQTTLIKPITTSQVLIKTNCVAIVKVSITKLTVRTRKENFVSLSFPLHPPHFLHSYVSFIYFITFCNLMLFLTLVVS